MKKIALIAMVAALGTTSANAGLLESLGLVKKAEPATLEEACDTAEIKKVCPEIILGTQTVTECLSENVKSLSKQCATFVKKSVTDKAAAAKQELVDARVAAKEKKAADKAAAAEKKAAAKEQVAAQKAAFKAAGKDIADAVRETGTAAKETGQAFKQLM